MIGSLGSGNMPARKRPAAKVANPPPKRKFKKSPPDETDVQAVGLLLKDPAREISPRAAGFIFPVVSVRMSLFGAWICGC